MPPLRLPVCKVMFLWLRVRLVHRRTRRGAGGGGQPPQFSQKYSLAGNL